MSARGIPVIAKPVSPPLGENDGLVGDSTGMDTSDVGSSKLSNMSLDYCPGRPGAESPGLPTSFRFMFLLQSPKLGSWVAPI